MTRVIQERLETKVTQDLRDKMDSQEKPELPDPRVHLERLETMELTYVPSKRGSCKAFHFLCFIGFARS